MKKILQALGVFVAVALVLYGMASFISMEPNVFEWGEGARVFYLVFVIVLSGAILDLYVFED